MNDEYVNVVGITFKKYGKKYYFDCHNLNLRKNLTVIVETERGLQFGTVITDIIKMDKKNIHYPIKVYIVMCCIDLLLINRNISVVKKIKLLYVFR